MKKGLVIFIMAILLLALMPAVLADAGDEYLVQTCACATPQYDNNDIKNGWWFRKPTCVNTGIVVVTCHNCEGSVNVTVASDPDAHVYTNTKWDCKEGNKCIHFGQTDSKGRVCQGIQAGSKHEDHDWEPATCTTPKTCRRAHCKLSVGDISNHKYIAATCTEPKHCENCGFSPEPNKLADHELVRTTIQTGTCEKDHKEYVKCKNCPYSYNSTTLAPGHKYGNWVIKRQACDQKGGYQQRVCSVCGKKDNQDLPKKDHVFYAWHTTKAATCTSTGTKARDCTVCGYVERGTIPVQAHKYGNWVIKRQACDEAGGYQQKSCSVCGKTEKQNLAKKEHSFYAWHTTKSATCTAAGTKERNCTVCGYVDHGTIPKLVHNMGSWTTTKAATCTAAGTQERKCTRSGCPHKETRTITAYGHSYNGAGKCIRCGKARPNNYVN